MIREKLVRPLSGYLALAILPLLQLGAIAVVISSLRGDPSLVMLFFGCLLNLVVLVGWFGFFLVQPNQAKVLQLFGKYVGTAREPGLRYANPFYSKKRVSVRIRNFESSKLKVNEAGGSPIEIAAVVVWRVDDTAEAVFEVDDFEEFVSIQSEAALRNLATSYLYESESSDEVTLRSHPLKIADALKEEVQARLEKAGMEVIEARISHLAYAPEIANAMLRRQQATAVVAARSKIVEGAVGMVEMALTQLNEKNIIELDDERKAAMVSNLLVVLCGEENAQPILNTGTLY